ncbi:MAG TPA: hypothetical protein PLZ79_06460 [Burkholderiales bacterium]|nr:hypothetical protein [Burkholderiales bacterium]
MNARLLASGLLACISMIGCGTKERSDDAAGYQVNISGLRMERQETRNESLKRTELEYNTKGSIEVTNAKGAKPSGFVSIKIADETGTAYGDTLAKDEFILIKDGIGKVEKRFSKTIPDGQSQPIPPKYTISAAGFVPFEPAEVVVGDNPPKEMTKTGLPRFQLIVEPIRVVKEDESYKGKGLLRLKALENVPNQPVFVFLNQKTIKHPTLEAPYEDKLALIIVMNGEGTTDITDYYGMTYSFDKDFDKIPRDTPQAAEYEYSIIGIYRMEPTKLAIN